MAIAPGHGRQVKTVAADNIKDYTVTCTSSECVHGEQHLLRSIFESLYALSQNSHVSALDPAPGNQEKEIA